MVIRDEDISVKGKQILVNCNVILKCEISHYAERSKMRKDSIFLTKQRIENELKEMVPGTADEEKINHEQICGKGKSVSFKNDNKEKDKPSLMLDARLGRAEQRSSKSDSKKQCDVIAFEDELQSTIANLFETVNEPSLSTVHSIIKD